MAALFPLALAWVGLALLVRIAWLDFQTMRIRNQDVIVLLGVALCLWASLTGGRDPWDLAAGGLMFVLGFTFWFFRLMGGGDAKLFLPLGILIGWNGLAPFALALVPASFLSLIALQMMRRYLPLTSLLAIRAHEIASSRGVPYAVPLLLATVPALLPRLGLG